ncbi:MAG: hypothetical protein ACLR67_01105 [Eggerthella lenta]
MLVGIAVMGLGIDRREGRFGHRLFATPNAAPTDTMASFGTPVGWQRFQLSNRLSPRVRLVDLQADFYPVFGGHFHGASRPASADEHVVLAVARRRHGHSRWAL